MEKPQVPKVAIDLDDFPEKERVTIWRELMAGVFDIQPLPTHEHDYYARGSAYDLGTTVLSDWVHAPSIINSDRNQSVLQREELLVLSRNPRGGLAGTVEDVNFEKKQAHLVVYDLEAKMSTKAVASRAQEFALPYYEVGYDPSQHARFLYLGHGTPISRIIELSFDAMIEMVPNCTPAEAKTLSDGFCGLLKGIISQNFRDEAARFHFFRAREAAVRRFVRQELRNPHLTADLVCMEIGLSRANLYRMFKPYGGFRKALLKMRLDGALAELSHTAPTYGAIVRVARNWTFFDQAHFSRAFKDAFGFRPSDALAAGLRTASDDVGRLDRYLAGSDAERHRLKDLYSIKSVGHLTSDAAMSSLAKKAK